MIQINKKNLEAAVSNPFYRAFNLFPGSYLLDHWKESRTQALSDIEDLSDENLKRTLSEEACNIKTAGDWAAYVIRKYATSFETN